MGKAKWYVDQGISGRVVSTQFDRKESAEAYAEAVGGKARLPVEAADGFGEKLFAALVEKEAVCPGTK